MFLKKLGPGERYAPVYSLELSEHAAFIFACPLSVVKRNSSESWPQNDRGESQRHRESPLCSARRRSWGDAEEQMYRSRSRRWRDTYRGTNVADAQACASTARRSISREMPRSGSGRRRFQVRLTRYAETPTRRKMQYSISTKNTESKSTILRDSVNCHEDQCQAALEFVGR
jgi:hypothetical protein